MTEQDESSTSDSSAASFSGFSSSILSGESSDDTSNSDSSSQIEPEKFDGYMSADATPDSLEITRGIDIADKPKPLSPMFGNLVDSVDSFPSSSKLNQLKPSGSHEKDSRSSINSSSFVIDGNYKESGATVPSDFWARTLDHKGSTSDSLIILPYRNSVEAMVGSCLVHHHFCSTHQMFCKHAALMKQMHPTSLFLVLQKIRKVKSLQMGKIYQKTIVFLQTSAILPLPIIKGIKELVTLSQHQLPMYLDPGQPQVFVHQMVQEEKHLNLMSVSHHL